MPWSKHTHDDAETYHDEPTQPAPEHVAAPLRYTITVVHYADYDVTADTQDEAEQAALDRARIGSPDSDFYLVEIDSVAEADD